MHILLTNDDGYASPLLPLIAGKLCALGRLTIVVPEREQSWQGKAVTRHGKLTVRELDLQGFQMHVLNGTPADCVNIGVYHLCHLRPDLVVAGLNIGQNAGLSYLFSSGTVGAGLEANICSLPAIAFSQALSPEIFREYHKTGNLPAGFREQVVRCSIPHLEEVLEFFMHHQSLLEPQVVWNVNFPCVFCEAASVRVCSAGRTMYDSLFHGEGREFWMQWSGERMDQNPECDSFLLAQGYITVTPLALQVLGALAQEKRQELQRLFDLAAVQRGRFVR